MRDLDYVSFPAPKQGPKVQVEPVLHLLPDHDRRGDDVCSFAEMFAVTKAAPLANELQFYLEYSRSRPSWYWCRGPIVVNLEYRFVDEQTGYMGSSGRGSWMRTPIVRSAIGSSAARQMIAEGFVR